MTREEARAVDIFVKSFRVGKIDYRQEYSYRYQDNDYTIGKLSDPYYYNETKKIQETIVSLDLPESSLFRVADIVTEFEQLMSDPETAKLLMEARFINRLKGRF